MTYSRLNDPTFASGDGQPPQHLKVGGEGKAAVKDGGNDQIVADLNGRVSPPPPPPTPFSSLTPPVLILLSLEPLPFHLPMGLTARSKVQYTRDSEADLEQVFVAARSAKFVILVEGVEGAKAEVISNTAASFAEGLQVLT